MVMLMQGFIIASRLLRDLSKPSIGFHVQIALKQPGGTAAFAAQGMKPSIPRLIASLCFQLNVSCTGGNNEHLLECLGPQ